MAAPLLIERYGAGRFKVAGVFHTGPILIRAEAVMALPPAPGAADVEGRLEGIEVLLWGCGARMAPVAPALRAACKANGVVVEPMDTGAAARTYNLLVAEGRRVAAVLIAVE